MRPRSSSILLIGSWLLIAWGAACQRQSDDPIGSPRPTPAGTMINSGAASLSPGSAGANAERGLGSTTRTSGAAGADAKRGSGSLAAQPALHDAGVEGQEDPASPDRWRRASVEQRQGSADGERLYAKTRHVWIYAEPDATKQWIGYLWSGGSVKLRSPKPKYGIGCDYFYAIEPRGYVCADGGRVTTDPNDPVVAALYPYAVRADAAWPHRYGESRGAPLYLTLPSEADQRNREPDLRRHLELVARARSASVSVAGASVAGASVAGAGAASEIDRTLVGIDLTPAPEEALEFPRLAVSVYEAHRALKNRSTVAYTKELRHAGRDFLLTADYRFIPKDRVAPYPFHRFKGLRLGIDAKLPLAFFRREGVARYRQTGGAHFERYGEDFARLTYVELTGKSARSGDIEFMETKTGDWIDRATVVVPTPSEKTPWDTAVGQPDSSPLRPKGRATWLEVSIRGGWLIGYEGTTPVFVTLVSPGRGGEPQRGRDPLETSATPLGRFSITGKFVTSTMVAPHEYLHSDVPFAQNFTGPYAIHAAYWHDNWGNLMSGGCINVSPIDALYLFQWTEPPAPSGWHGTRWLPYLEPATTLVIHR